MVRHGGGVFERAAVFQIGRDAGCAKRVIADLGRDVGTGGTPADHGVGILLGQGRPGELPGRAADGAEQRALGIGGAAWAFSSAAEGIYRLDIFLAAGDPRAVDIFVNNEFWKHDALNLTTHGACFYLDRCGEWVSVGDLILKKGINQIALHRGAGIAAIGALRFVPKESQ
jgi:hypothetical protein